jgi:general secretion pathway protein N
VNVRSRHLVTNGLIGVCAVLCLAAVVQYAGFGRGYRWLVEAPDAAGVPPVGKIDREPFKLPPATEFAAIEQRPLFNDDRKPTPIDATAEAAADAPPEKPLNVTLTGVIVTPGVHIALVRDNARNQSMALKVGMPLEGDQASWVLTEVKARSAVFTSASNEESEIELETAAAPARPGRTPSRPPARRSASGGFLPHTVASKAAQPARNDRSDLAKRIEERRKKMREDAERLRKQRAGAKPPAHKK